jgi:hypothetical protein
MPAVRTPGSYKPVGEDAALEVAAELTLHIGRHALSVPVIFTRQREVGLQVLHRYASPVGAVERKRSIR